MTLSKGLCSNLEQMSAFQAKLGISAETCLAIVAGYADSVDQHLANPKIKLTSFKSFLVALEKMVNAQNESIDDAKPMASASSAKVALPREEVLDSGVQKVELENSMVVEYSQLSRTKVAAANPGTNGGSKENEVNVTYQLDDQARAFEELVGSKANFDPKRGIVNYWEETFPLNDYYSVRIAVKEGPHVYVQADLINSQNQSCCRLKPRLDSLSGEYVFTWDNQRFVLKIV